MDQIHNMRWLYEMTECTIPRCYQSQSTPSINAGRPRRATQRCYWPIKYCKSEPYSSEYFEALIFGTAITKEAQRRLTERSRECSPGHSPLGGHMLR